MINRANTAALFTPIYDEFMLSEYKENDQVCPILYQSIDDKTKDYKADDMSGFGIWEEATEGEGGGYEDPTLGYPKTFTQGKQWKKFQVTFEAVDQDEYALLKKEGTARSLGRGSRARIETDAATVLTGGFATAGPDGEYLYDTDHPRNREQTDSDLESDNLLTGAFSHDNLELAETQIANNYVDPAGIPIPQPAKAYIVHPPAIRGKIKRVLSDRAGEQPDTALRNINRFAGAYDSIEWVYIDSARGGSDTQWHIIFPEMDYLKIVWSARPHFTSWIDEDAELYKFKGRMLYALGASNWRFGFGSTGL